MHFSEMDIKTFDGLLLSSSFLPDDTKGITEGRGDSTRTFFKDAEGLTLVRGQIDTKAGVVKDVWIDDALLKRAARPGLTEATIREAARLAV